MHPVRTAKRAVTPRSVRQLSRAAYTVTNPLGAAENALIGAALGGGGSRRRTSTRPEPAKRAVPTTMTAADLRAVEAATSDSQLAALMAVQRERFALAQRPIIADPLQVDPAPFAHEEWRRRKHETRVWQRARRVQLRTEVAGYAQAVAAERYTQACQQQRVQQSQADRWWQALNAGDPSVLTAALAAAFADNPAPVEIIRAGGDASVLRVWLPGIEVLPERRAAVTPTGRRSTKAWTKTDRNEVYATVLGAHLLATAREAWAVAPSLARMQIGGMRRLPDGSMELLFDVAVSRSQGRWSDDDWGTHVLANVPRGLNRVGRTQEVRAWPAA
jgi:hypothetical protein